MFFKGSVCFSDRLSKTHIARKLQKVGSWGWRSFPSSSCAEILVNPETIETGDYLVHVSKIV